MLPVAILAGGLATRLRPATETIPKALLEIHGEPFLAHQLRLLKQNGVGRVVLCVGHLGEQIERFAGDGNRFGVRIDYSHDGDRLLGTAGALRRALPLLGEAFLVLYGDSYLLCNFNNVEQEFVRSGKTGMMTVFRNEGRWDRSNVEFAEGRILAYDKVNPTPRMRHIDYGLGALRAGALDALPEAQPHDLAQVYQNLLQRGELAAMEVSERFFEIGSVEGIADLRKYLSK